MSRLSLDGLLGPLQSINFSTITDHLVPLVVGVAVSYGVGRLLTRLSYGKRLGSLRAPSALEWNRRRRIRDFLVRKLSQPLVSRAETVFGLMMIGAAAYFSLLKVEVPFQPLPSVLGACFLTANFWFLQRSRKNHVVGYEKGFQADGTFHRYTKLDYSRTRDGRVYLDASRYSISFAAEDVPALARVIKYLPFTIERNRLARSNGTDQSSINN